VRREQRSGTDECRGRCENGEYETDCGGDLRGWRGDGGCLNAQQTRGYNVYQAHCAQCHNDRTNDPLNGQSLRGIFKKQYLASGAPANDDRVMDAVLYGRAMMPALGSAMTPLERADLMAYLHTL
jgi:cytochrome c5